ncbi:MAG: sigma-70 family RNA polymerase sigma factor [Planctomycetia bacterium]|nr:sigma-70 family RNA polymerase sigma factor [Planctomycetia bacterium]
MSNTTDDQEDGKREQAIDAFLTNYHYVENVAYQTAPCSSLQHDIVHDTFIEFVKKSNQWDYSRNIKPLLRKITEIVALRYRYKWFRNLPESVRQIYENAVLPYLESENQKMGDNENDRLSALDSCLKKLPPHIRQLVEAYYFGDQSFADLEKSTGQKESTIRKTMCRIRNALRECIVRFQSIQTWEDET